MARTDIFQDPTKSIPRGDARIVRVSMEQDELTSRKANAPKNLQNNQPIKHVQS